MTCRALALTTLLSVGGLWLSQRAGDMQHLPRAPRLLLHGLLGVTALQVR